MIYGPDAYDWYRKRRSTSAAWVKTAGCWMGLHTWAPVEIHLPFGHTWVPHAELSPMGLLSACRTLDVLFAAAAVGSILLACK